MCSLVTTLVSSAKLPPSLIFLLTETALLSTMWQTIEKRQSYEKIVNSITALIDSTNADLYKNNVK